MLVRIPPGTDSGVPIGELFLLIFLFSITNIRKIIFSLDTILFLPFILWWSYGVIRAITAIPDHGMWALRDATHVIDSVYFLVGVAFATNLKKIDWLFSWFRRTLLIGCLYALTFPFKDLLADFSPTIRSATGNTTTILFHYQTAQVILFLSAVECITTTARKFRKLLPFLAAILIAYAIGIFQSRTAYLQFSAILLFLLLIYRPVGIKRSDQLWRLIIPLAVGSFMFVILSSLEIGIVGRMNQQISLDFLWRHVASIAGVKGEGVEGAAHGVYLRLYWWSSIWKQLSDSAEAMLFGLGYGVPLTNFRFYDYSILREPHNSIISVAGRGGLLGLLLFFWCHLVLLRQWYRAYFLSRILQDTVARQRLALMMSYFILILVYSLAEDALEKPYHAIPYYFFWGVIAQYRWHLERVAFENGFRLSKRNAQAIVSHNAHPSNT